MTNFKSTFEQLKAEQEALNLKMKEAKKEAIRHVQEIIKEFDILASELAFGEEPVKRTRAPSAPMYRTPTGIEWSGKGLIKKELKAYLEENGLTLEDVKIK